MDIQPSNPIIVFLTASTADEGSQIAEMLVGRKLAACVQLLPEMKSIYFWKGEVQRESEVLILAKTTQENFADLEREVRAIHSYETPEIVALEIAAVSEPYLKWLTACLEGS